MAELRQEGGFTGTAGELEPVIDGNFSRAFGLVAEAVSKPTGS
jgi:hypothetical protein